LLYSVCLLLVLHPLPTTRSSDLSAGAHPRPRIETLADLIFGLSLSIGSIALIANPPKSTEEITTHILAFGGFAMRAIEPIESDKDRKSTRLNSSHGSNSYAVFCL